jgi:hypothetical protein
MVIDYELQVIDYKPWINHYVFGLLLSLYSLGTKDHEKASA